MKNYSFLPKLKRFLKLVLGKDALAVSDYDYSFILIN
jgi:hypothetical protein